MAELVWRAFDWRDIRAAYRHAEAGIAVHVCPPEFVGPKAPRVFRGRRFAHLFGPDRVSLVSAAKSLGCKPSWLQHDGDDVRRHFDITGWILEEALSRCENRKDFQ